MADDARTELMRLAHKALVEASGGPDTFHPTALIVDTLLGNPVVVVRALIAAGHASLSLMDGTPVYLIETQER